MRFDGGGHGVGGVHAAAGAAPGQAWRTIVLALVLGDLAGEPFAVGLKGGDDVELCVFAANLAKPALIVPP